MKKEPLALSHKELIAPLLAKLSVNLSEYSFANLYLFREAHDYQVVYLADETICIEGKTYDGLTYCMPLFLPNTTVNSIEMHPFFPIPEQWLPLFLPEKWKYEYKEDDSDYLYNAQKLATYSGRHLSKKRNLVYQFLNSYTHFIAPLSQSTINDALLVIDAWQSHNGKESDTQACIEAVRLYRELGLEGTVYYVEGKPAGLIIAEPITKDTCVLHFAKADIQYKGLYQFLFQDTAIRYQSCFVYLNMEQDLGEESLRKSKHSYQPEILLKKYRIFYLK